MCAGPNQDRRTRANDETVTYICTVEMKVGKPGQAFFETTVHAAAAKTLRFFETMVQYAASKDDKLRAGTRCQDTSISFEGDFRFVIDDNV